MSEGWSQTYSTDQIIDYMQKEVYQIVINSPDNNQSIADDPLKAYHLFLHPPVPLTHLSELENQNSLEEDQVLLNLMQAFKHQDHSLYKELILKMVKNLMGRRFYGERMVKVWRVLVEGVADGGIEIVNSVLNFKAQFYNSYMSPQQTFSLLQGFVKLSSLKLPSNYLRVPLLSFNPLYTTLLNFYLSQPKRYIQQIQNIQILGQKQINQVCTLYQQISSLISKQLQQFFKTQMRQWVIQQVSKKNVWLNLQKMVLIVFQKEEKHNLMFDYQMWLALEYFKSHVLQKKISGIKLLLKWLDKGKQLAVYLWDHGFYETLISESIHAQIMRLIPPLLQTLYFYIIPKHQLQRLYIQSLQPPNQSIRILFQGLLVLMNQQDLQRYFCKIASIKTKQITRQVIYLLEGMVHNDVMKRNDQKGNGLPYMLLSLITSHLLEYDPPPISHLLSPILSHHLLVILLQSLVGRLRSEPNIQLLSLFEVILTSCCKSQVQVFDKLVRQGIMQYWMKCIIHFEDLKLLKWIERVKGYGKVDRNVISWLWQIMVVSKQQQRSIIINFLRAGIGSKGKRGFMTEQGINYFMFQILLRLDVTSICDGLYICIQEYILHINIKANLISTVQTDLILNDHDLIGFQTIWEILFKTNNLKVYGLVERFIINLMKNNVKNKTQLLQKFYLQVVSGICRQIQMHMLNKDKGFQAHFEKILKFIIKVLDQVDQLSAIKSIHQYSEEITIIIDNREQDALPPKKFAMKLYSNMKVSEAVELIGKKLNPERKDHQIQLMTRGNLIKNLNLSLKQYKIRNRQTIMVIKSLQIQPLPLSCQLLNQEQQAGKLSQLKQIFTNIDEQLLKFLIAKKPNDQIHELASIIVDDEKLQVYQKQKNKVKDTQKDKEKEDMELRISQVFGNSSEFLELCQQIMALKIQTLSKYTWCILSILPGNLKQLNQLKKFCFKQGNLDWKSYFRQQMSFQNLYLIQQMAYLVVGSRLQNAQHNQQLKKLRQTFLQKGGLKYIFQYFKKQNYRQIKIQPLQAQKLLIYLLQIIKVYLRMYLQTNAPSDSILAIKQIINYKQKIKDIGALDIDTLLDPPKQKSQTSKYTKTMSFRFSSTSRSVSSVITPNFQSPNTSRSNSPFQPNRMQQLSEVPKNKQKKQKQKFGSEVSFIMVCPTKNQNINIQKKQQVWGTMDPKDLSQIVGVIQLELLMERSLQILSTVSLEMTEDLQTIYQYCFDIVLPLLLVDHNLQKAEVLLKTNLPQFLNHPTAQIRHSFVFLLYLLCLLDENNIHRQMLDRIFNDFVCKMQKGKVYYEDCFICMCKVAKVEEWEIGDKWKWVEQGEGQGLAGLLLLFTTIYKNQIPQNKHQHLILLNKLLFQINQQDTDLTKYPKISKRSTRKRAFALIAQMAKQEEDIQLLKKILPDIGLKVVQQPMRTGKFVGLKNLGATCYINSLIQQLFMILPIRNHLFSLYSQCPTSQSLHHLFLQLNSSLKQYLSPWPLIHSLQLDGKPIDVVIQQDVNQFFIALIDKLQSQNSKVGKYIGGVIQHWIVSMQKKYPFEKRSQQGFYSLVLDIKGKSNLHEALDNYVKGQIMQGQNKYFCQEYNQKLRVLRKCRLKTLPNTLVITLKRFEFDYQLMIRNKLNDYFQFPMEIDFSPWMKLETNDHIQEEQLYHLVGILVHTGNADAGHYYSFIKDRTDNQNRWYQFNDSLICQFSTDKIASECFGGIGKQQCNEWESKSKSAYLLFYQKQLQSSLLWSQYNEQVMRRQNIEYMRSRLVHQGQYYQFLQNTQLKKYKKVKYTNLQGKQTGSIF